MSKTILFWPDVYKEQGHWLPTLKWADALHNAGHTVKYMGMLDCKGITDAYQEENSSSAKYDFLPVFQNMYPKGYTTESSSDPNERWKTWHIWAILYSQYFDLIDENGEVVDSNIEFNLPSGARMPNNDLIEDAKSIWKAWTLANPNLLVSGYFTSLETLLLYWIYGLKANEDAEAGESGGENQNNGENIEPELESDGNQDEATEFERVRRKDLDFVISTTYLRHPQDDPAIRARVNLQSFSRPELHKIINMATKGIISTEAPEMTLQKFTQPLESFNELIPCPREFEYDHYKHGFLVHYVDPCITKELSRSAPSIDSEGEPINWSEYIAKENIIFVTAGSQVLDYEDKAKNLFHSMCKAMQSPQLNGYFLIIAAGSKLVNSLEWKNYDKSRILIASWVPQRDLLSCNNLKCAIIHGGLATIKECVYFNRKFIINPLGKDQIDNALRLKHLGIDNMLSMANVNPNTLLNAINRVISDYRLEIQLEKLSTIFQTLEDEDAKESAFQNISIKTGFKIMRDILNAQDVVAPQPNQGEMC
mgnify:CR=1 FL=1